MPSRLMATAGSSNFAASSVDDLAVFEGLRRRFGRRFQPDPLTKTCMSHLDRGDDIGGLKRLDDEAGCAKLDGLGDGFTVRCRRDHQHRDFRETRLVPHFSHQINARHSRHAHIAATQIRFQPRREQFPTLRARFPSATPGRSAITRSPSGRPTTAARRWSELSRCRWPPVGCARSF